MKNLILMLFFTFGTLFTQAQMFDGIPVQGNLDAFIKRMQVKKYKLAEKHEGGVAMSGYIANKLVEVYIGATPKTNQVNRITVYFTEWQDWKKLKGDYDNIISLFVDKYGYPDKKYSQFLEPYGDIGTEMTAVEMDKSLFQSYWWNKEGANLSVQISKYKQVRIIYENIKNTELYEQEESSIKKTKF